MESPHCQKQATPKSWNSLGESLYNYCKIILFGFDKYICQLWFIVEYVTLFIFANYDLQIIYIMDSIILFASGSTTIIGPPSQKKKKKKQ